MLGGFEGAELGSDAAEQYYKGAREEETWNATDSGSVHGRETLAVVSLVKELDGLESTNISGDEAEDGDTDAALDEDTEVRELEEIWACIGRRRGPHEVGEPGGSEMFDNDERGGDATETLFIITMVLLDSSDGSGTV